jgi:hypothetical protein
MFRRLLERVTVVWVLSRIAIVLVVFFWFSVFPSHPTIPVLVNQFDSGWYLSIIANGYSRANSGEYITQQNWAFFPLYPIFSGIMTNLSQWGKEYASLLISNVFAWGAMVVASLYYKITRPATTQAAFKRPAQKSLLFLLGFGVGSFYLSLPYAEALFLLLTALGFYYLHRRQYYLAIFFAALMSATSALGVFFMPVILVQIFLNHAGEKKSWWGKVKAVYRSHRREIITTLLAAPSGLIIFMTYLYLRMGDGLAWLKVHHAWRRDLFGALTTLKSDYSMLEIWWLSLSMLVCLALILWSLRKHRRWGELLFATMYLLVPLSSSFYSAPRYFIGCLPLVLMGADALGTLKPRSRWACFAVMMGLNIFLFYSWLIGKRIAM